MARDRARRRLNLRLVLVGLSAAFLLAACTRLAPAPGVPRDLPRGVLDELAPMPPKLAPVGPLPGVGGSVPLAQALTPLAGATDRVAMRVLVVGTTADDPGVVALSTALDQIGTPYHVLLAATEPLTSDALVSLDGVGRFQAVMLTDAALSFEASAGVWTSAFDATEWNLLWQYERDYGVRQVAFYAYPGTYPEDYGVRLAGTAEGDPPVRASLTDAGRQLFGYLDGSAAIDIASYAYLATLDGSGGVDATPLMLDGAGNVLAVTAPSTDGRERLALTFSGAWWLLHSQALAYGLVDWATRGVFLGDRRIYVGIEADDWFLPTDVWSAAVGGLDGSYRLGPEDVLTARSAQAQLRASYPLASQLTLSLAFNGEGADASAPASCDPAVAGPDPLSSVTKCVVNDFRWVNHTYSHAYMDWTDYAQAREQITQNRSVAAALGIADAPGYQPQSLVTGDFSGLGWHAPEADPDGAKTDFGLLASNPDFLNAAVSTGIRLLASNASVASQQAACFGCGLPHPLAPSVLLVPRYPTNVFYAATTPEDMIDLYNAIYGPDGTEPYFDHDLSYAEYLDFDTDIALMHLLSGSPYYHYLHVGNLREYAPGRSLVYDWLDALLAKYSALFDLPLRSLDWAQLGATVADRTSYAAAVVSGVIDRTAGQATLTSREGGVVIATGLSFGSTVSYGGELQSRQVLPAGGSITVAVP